jgi:hypothetical protein
MSDRPATPGPATPDDAHLRSLIADVVAAYDASAERMRALAARLPGGAGASPVAVLCEFIAAEYHWTLRDIAGLDDRQMQMLVGQALRRRAATQAELTRPLSSLPPAPAEPAEEAVHTAVAEVPAAPTVVMPAVAEVPATPAVVMQEEVTPEAPKKRTRRSSRAVKKDVEDWYAERNERPRKPLGEMAKEIHCDPRTLNRVIENSCPEIQDWLREPEAAPRVGGLPKGRKGTDLNDAILHRLKDHRELDPFDRARIEEYRKRSDLTDKDRRCFEDLQSEREQLSFLNELAAILDGEAPEARQRHVPSRA